MRIVDQLRKADRWEDNRTQFAFVLFSKQYRPGASSGFDAQLMEFQNLTDEIVHAAHICIGTRI